MGNRALSFTEFMAALQRKPWSALLGKVITNGEVVNINQDAAVAKGKSDAQPAVRAALQKLFDSYDIDGSLEIREGLPQRRACCFRECNVPKAWDVPEIMWCYDQHIRVSVGL